MYSTDSPPPRPRPRQLSVYNNPIKTRENNRTLRFNENNYNLQYKQQTEGGGVEFCVCENNKMRKKAYKQGHKLNSEATPARELRVQRGGHSGYGFPGFLRSCWHSEVGWGLAIRLQLLAYTAVCLSHEARLTYKTSLFAFLFFFQPPKRLPCRRGSVIGWQRVTFAARVDSNPIVPPYAPPSVRTFPTPCLIKRP